MRTLRGIRNDLDLNQAEMAEQLGISRASYQRYESYQSKTIPFEVILMMADKAGIEDLRTIQYKK